MNDTEFWNHVAQQEGCWLWTGTLWNTGYGQVTHNKKQTTAHRVAYSLTHGELPRGAVVCHHCDNPPCVRPDHLFLGSHATNAQDRNSKGRGVNQTYLGSTNTNARLDESQVVQIRKLREAGESLVAIGSRFDVSKSTVSKIVNWKTWTHI